MERGNLLEFNMSDTNAPYKVVLVFNLKPGAADEELQRSVSPDGFPSRLAAQPGFVSLELVRAGADRTLSIQTWRSEADWWSALSAVKSQESAGPAREDILVSRDFFGGPVVVQRSAA